MRMIRDGEKFESVCLPACLSVCVSVCLSHGLDFVEAINMSLDGSPVAPEAATMPPDGFPVAPEADIISPHGFPVAPKNLSENFFLEMGSVRRTSGAPSQHMIRPPSER